eukprot:CCRYP_018546-RA/>CCRYP_018546-RA protein AED:0.47 eAED:0.47 QI:0/0/0/1/0/0/2/0/80
MFVNGIPFLGTLSRDIKLGSIEFLPSRTAKQLTNALECAFLYARASWTWSLKSSRVTLLQRKSIPPPQENMSEISSGISE